MLGPRISVATPPLATPFRFFRIGAHHFVQSRAQAAFAVVMTSELAKYGNILLKKGVTPPFVG